MRLSNATEALAYIRPGANVVVSSLNGEPSELLAAIEHAQPDVTIHQMHPMVSRGYMKGNGPTRYRSYFLSHADRPHGVEYVPANFSQIPALLDRLPNLIVLTTVAEQDGRLYWGTNAEYVAALVEWGVPAIVEVNSAMPAVTWAPELEEVTLAKLYVDRPLAQVATPEPTPEEAEIARLVAERIPDGATLQIGIGAVPNMVLRYLTDRRNLRVWTELLTDGIVDLADAGALAPGMPITATLAAGTDKLYEYMARTNAINMRPCHHVLDPAAIAHKRNMVSVCAATEVDLAGQVVAETIGGRYYSGTGGQLDFQIGAYMAEGGQGFIVMPSTAKHGTLSRIVKHLTPGSVVTTPSQYVDHVVTEFGVADLKGKTQSERKYELAAIAHINFMDGLI